MSERMNIIPSPKYAEFTEGKVFSVSGITIAGKSDVILENALRLMGGVKLVEQDEADLLIFTSEEFFGELLSSGECELFTKEFASEQGYIIKRIGDRTYLFGKCPLGCAYGIMTLIQLIGLPIGEFYVRDYPDFEKRGIKWTCWAETGAFSYDFGDGVEGMKERLERKLDMLFKYKINYIHADGFGFDADRFDGYAELFRHISDYARARGITVAEGGYLMSYGMVGHLNSYQGKHFFNRESYPDGEIYSCIGTYDTEKPDVIKGADRGTCLSNEELFKLKLEEISDFVKRTHITGLSLHNMDADEIHPQLWAARCPRCRKKWPNDSLFASDGCAGAFAEYIDKLSTELYKIEDGDYKASRDLKIRMVSPGYLYAKKSTDEVFDLGIEFWRGVSENKMADDNFAIGFREQFFYHKKNVKRVDALKEKIVKTKSFVQNFSGADGFYDDKLFTPTASLNYIMKGYSGMCIMCGNAFQEPLAVFNAEYNWNAEDSAFYNPPRAETFDEFYALYMDMIRGRVRPPEIYGDGGFIDVICEKLYGTELGDSISKIYKLSGKNAEPPIACAANVDIYTNYTKVVFPMRWDNLLTTEEIDGMTERFSECLRMSEEAYKILLSALDGKAETPETRDLTWLLDCFDMGRRLTGCLYDYMKIFKKLDKRLNDTESPDGISDEISLLKEKIAEFSTLVRDDAKRPLDKLGGPFIRRREMADFLEYNTDIMIYSIEQRKRIPDGLRPLPTREWW